MSTTELSMLSTDGEECIQSLDNELSALKIEVCVNCL